MNSVTFTNNVTAPGAREFLDSIFSVVTYMAIPVIILALMYAGFMFITARGNWDKIRTATYNVSYVILGAALILGAYMIANLLYNTIVKGILGWN